MKCKGNFAQRLRKIYLENLCSISLNIQNNITARPCRKERQCSWVQSVC